MAKEASSNAHTLWFYASLGVWFCSHPFVFRTIFLSILSLCTCQQCRGIPLWSKPTAKRGGHHFPSNSWSWPRSSALCPLHQARSIHKWKTWSHWVNTWQNRGVVQHGWGGHWKINQSLFLGPDNDCFEKGMCGVANTALNSALRE